MNCLSAWVRGFVLSSILLVMFFAAAERSALAAPLLAELRGTVRAENDSLVPGVIVGLTCGQGSSATLPVRVITDEKGSFDFKSLDPAVSCLIKAEIPGYATVVLGPISLRPGKINVQEIRLIPAADVTTNVLVEAKGGTVDTESAVTSTTINEDYIQALPIVGRSFQALLTLAPGVTDVDGDGNPNVHGARDTGLQYRLDGADVTDPLTGHYGQVLNLDAIQEVELITSGASAEYGRADGGFAIATTKSGTNEFEGSLRLFYRAIYFDGDGAGARNNDTLFGALPPTRSFRDMKSALSLGGPIVRNRLWYFTSVQGLSIQTPVTRGGAGTVIQTQDGYQGLAKLTWQISSDNKVSLEGNFDPQRFGGLGLGPGVLPESDYVFRTGGLTDTFRWTSILSPVLLMETALSHFDTGNSYTPVSNRFKPTNVTVRADSGVSHYALYPCNRTNCFRDLGPTNIYQFDQTNNVVSGPYYYQNGDRRVRNSLRSDFNVNLDDAWGTHSIRTGFEFTDEIYVDNAVNNPVLFSSLHPPRFRDRTSSSGPLAVGGIQLLTVFDALRTSPRASGGGLGFYVQENWKPRPNLTIGAGVRIDQELVDTFGKEPFPLRAQAREALRRFDLACSIAGVLCDLYRTPGKTSGGLPPRMPIPPGSPLEKFDLNEDGVFDSGRDQDGAAIWGLYTKPEDRQSQNFTLTNTNLAPRLSVSWDPWNDGRTRVSATYGRYFDRLFLGEVTEEQFPDEVNFVFVPGQDPTPWISPGDRSLPTYTRSVFMVNRRVTTPYTDERTFSVEREIAPEWSVTVTSIYRQAFNLLQDFDVNHILCPDYRRVLGVDPHTICNLSGGLNPDIFGGLRKEDGSNGAVDLYSLNPNFNQVFRVGNYNGSRYRAGEIVINRRLHRNWQMQVSYSRSRAIGDAETFLSSLGDDPAFRDKQRGFLDYDQRNVVKAFASTHLPKRVVLGGSIIWWSGTPYSAVYSLTDFDDVGNASPRISYLNGKRNDQRNGGQWTASARIEKGFSVLGRSAEAYFAVENLLDNDDLVLREVQVGGNGLAFRDFNRRFGRRWEMGMSLHF